MTGKLTARAEADPITNPIIQRQSRETSERPGGSCLCKKDAKRRRSADPSLEIATDGGLCGSWLHAVSGLNIAVISARDSGRRGRTKRFLTCPSQIPVKHLASRGSAGGFVEKGSLWAVRQMLGRSPMSDAPKPCLSATNGIAQGRARLLERCRERRLSLLRHAAEAFA